MSKSIVILVLGLISVLILILILILIWRGEVVGRCGMWEVGCGCGGEGRIFVLILAASKVRGKSLCPSVLPYAPDHHMMYGILRTCMVQGARCKMQGRHLHEVLPACLPTYLLAQFASASTSESRACVRLVQAGFGHTFPPIMLYCVLRSTVVPYSCEPLLKRRSLIGVFSGVGQWG